MSGYIGNTPVPQATQTRQTFTATSGQTSFATIGYVAGGQFTQVFLNGSLLKLTSDYTASNGSDIVLTTAASAGDIIEFITFAEFSVGNQNFSGGITVSNNGQDVLTLDRSTSDGTIINVKKSGISVGSIGTHSSELSVGTGDTGIKFSAANNAVYPFDPSSSDIRGDSISLGKSTSRFSDLYLSGGIYLGGTGSANKLDDVETGNWTPGIAGAGSGVRTMGSSNAGFYEKVGSIVHVWATVHVNGTETLTGMIKLTNLPYASLGTSNYRANATNAGNTLINTPTGYEVRIGIDAGVNYAWITQASDDLATYSHNPTISNSGFLYGFTMTYRTT